MSKGPFNIDERVMTTFYRICTTLYILTLMALIGIQFYRQFVLGQPSQAWDDLAMLLTLNVLVLLGSLLYLSGWVNPRKINPRHLITGYVLFVLLGLGWTVVKYGLILNQSIGWVEVGGYASIIIKITAILVLGWGVLAYLGNRRIEKQIE